MQRRKAPHSAEAKCRIVYKLYGDDEQPEPGEGRSEEGEGGGLGGIPYYTSPASRGKKKAAPAGAARKVEMIVEVNAAGDAPLRSRPTRRRVSLGTPARELPGSTPRLPERSLCHYFVSPLEWQPKKSPCRYRLDRALR